MSTELVKSIKIDEKNNKIFFTSCASNMYPHEYKKWEYCSTKDGDYSFKYKVCSIFKHMSGRNIRLPKSNKWYCLYLEIEKILGELYEGVEDDLIYSAYQRAKVVYAKNKEKDKIIHIVGGFYDGRYIDKMTSNKLLLSFSKENAGKFNQYQIEDIKLRYGKDTDFKILTIKR